MSTATEVDDWNNIEEGYLPVDDQFHIIFTQENEEGGIFDCIIFSWNIVR